MKNFFKVMAALTMVLSIMLMTVSCGGQAAPNENFDYIMDYFRDNIVEDEQELVHCDITSDSDGYLLTYSYVDNDVPYVVVITFNEECEITRYDAYYDGQYEDKTKD